MIGQVLLDTLSTTDLTFLTMKVKLFTEDRNNLQFIQYDHDCGHAYSYIDNPIVGESEETDLEDVLNEWLYENDDLPECKSWCDTCH